MPVNNAVKSLARDGRFSVEDATKLQSLVEEGKVTEAEATETLQRYGDVMDPEASRMLESFTGARKSGALAGLPAPMLDKTLAKGMKNEDVRTLQRGLMTLGQREQNPALTMEVGVDGQFGQQTADAVRAFQQLHDIAPTGKADPATMRALDGALRGQEQQRAPTPLAPVPQAAVQPRRGLTPPQAPAKPPWQRAGEAGDKSITDKTQKHSDGIDEGGIGDLYGDRGNFATAVHSGDKAAVQAQLDGMEGGWQVKSMKVGSVVVENAAGETKTMRESSCIGWVMDNTKAAYAAAGKSERFAEIEQKMRAGGMRGTILCEELKKDGWTAVFYSPRTAEDLKATGDPRDKEKLAALRMAEKGQAIWKSPVAGSTGVRPDAVVTGYRDSDPDPKTDELLKRLESSPFLVGVANGGTHTFVGHGGNVSDFHWTAEPNDKGAITEHTVREWEWDTGLYMVPPGNWAAAQPNS